MVWETMLVLVVISAIAIITYSLLVQSSDNERQAEEDFKAFLEEKERVKNGRHNNVQ